MKQRNKEDPRATILITTKEEENGIKKERLLRRLAMTEPPEEETKSNPKQTGKTNHATHRVVGKGLVPFRTMTVQMKNQIGDFPRSQKGKVNIPTQKKEAKGKSAKCSAKCMERKIEIRVRSLIEDAPPRSRDWASVVPIKSQINKM
jgi:hypothetical protein